MDKKLVKKEAIIAEYLTGNSSYRKMRIKYCLRHLSLIFITFTTMKNGTITRSNFAFNLTELFSVERRRASANSTYKKLAVQWLNEVLCFYDSLVQGSSTSGFSTQISVENSSYMIERNDNGNIFIADDNHGKAKLRGEIINLKTRWLDNENSLIEFDKNARIFKDKNSKKGVNIVYKKLE